ncbi:hypothetical protein [Halostella salina]|uniref:hypothetical protein n=1 Tax=Halostella salina TaxID=1547897 RepID=UPI0013CE7186|nr:hypothetical protein [Halostella salina]
MTDTVTRRALLRRTAAATGGLAVGAAGLSGTAAATLDCPRPVRWWENHPAAFNDTRTSFRLDRSEARYDRETTYALLRESPGADRALQLAQQAVAAQANVAAIRVGDGGACHEAATAIKPRIGDALTWLARSDGTADDRWAYAAAPDEYGLTWSWEDARGVDGEPVRDDLRAFNEGRTCAACGGGDGTDGEQAEDADDPAENAADVLDGADIDSPFPPWRRFIENNFGQG